MNKCYPHITPMPKQTLAEIRMEKADRLTKTYLVRKTGREGRSLEITIPREVFDREARRLGMEPDDAVSKLNAVWSYNCFEGLYLSFHPKKARKDLSHPASAKKGGDVPV